MLQPSHIQVTKGWNCWGNQHGSSKPQVMQRLREALHDLHINVHVLSAANEEAAAMVRDSMEPEKGVRNDARMELRVEACLLIQAKTKHRNAMLPLSVALGVYMFAKATPWDVQALLSMLGVACSRTWTRQFVAYLASRLPLWWTSLPHHLTIRRSSCDNNQYRCVQGVEREETEGVEARKDRKNGFHALTRLEVHVCRFSLPSYTGPGAYASAPTCEQVRRKFEAGATAVAATWLWAWEMHAERPHQHILRRPRVSADAERTPWIARASMTGLKTNTDADLQTYLERLRSENPSAEAVLDEGDHVSDHPQPFAGENIFIHC
jgi:hypothetical protein